MFQLKSINLKINYTYTLFPTNCKVCPGWYYLDINLYLMLNIILLLNISTCVPLSLSFSQHVIVLEWKNYFFLTFPPVLTVKHITFVLQSEIKICFTINYSLHILNIFVSCYIGTSVSHEMFYWFHHLKGYANSFTLMQLTCLVQNPHYYWLAQLTC